MARKMDRFAVNRDAVKDIDKRLEKQAKVISELKKQRQVHEALITKGLQNSTEGTIDGRVVFRKKESTRRTATIGRVMEFAPELSNKIIQETTSYKIEVL